ncbi:MAG: cytochrome c maturation protein CcmE [Ekhidna sp.]|nr:cytochrome c maturation protein CcmE [Ekhidna sp.]
MKAKYILGIVIIAAAIVIIMTMTGDASSYVSFTEAKDLSDKGFKRSIHVVGELPKTAGGKIIGIEESPDKLSFKFQMVDEDGFKQQVLHANPIPADFDKSEQVVIIGTYKGEIFIAEKILLKCPSKYQEDPEFTS